MRWSTLSALLVSVLIIVTGGVVRVSGSGLGCPTWPTCTPDSLTPPVTTGITGIIEFTNRSLTGVLCAAVGWVIVSVRLQREPNRALSRTAWAQFWIVVLNAVVGGITVWTGLNPYVVAAHFVAALLLVAATTVTYDLVRRPEAIRAGTLRLSRRPLDWVLMSSAAPLVIVGTVVTGTGPHPGDSHDVYRIPLDWVDITVLHGVLAVIVLGIAGYRAYDAGRRHARLALRRSVVLVGVLLAQGAVGVFQSVSGLPNGAVILHLLGAALIWAGVVRLLLTDPDAEHASDPRASASLPAAGVAG
jgi:heme a synthase